MCGGEKKGKKRNAAPRAWRIKKEGEKKGKKEKKMGNDIAIFSQ